MVTKKVEKSRENEDQKKATVKNGRSG